MINISIPTMKEVSANNLENIIVRDVFYSLNKIKSIVNYREVTNNE